MSDYDEVERDAEDMAREESEAALLAWEEDGEKLRELLIKQNV